MSNQTRWLIAATIGLVVALVTQPATPARSQGPSATPTPTSTPPIPTAWHPPVIDQPLAIQTVSEPVYKLDWHPSGQFLAVSSADGLAIYDEALAEVAHVLEGTRIYGVSWEPTGTRLAVTHAHSIEIWDWDAGALTFVAAMEADYAQIAVEWSPDGTRIASVEITDDRDLGVGTFHFWDALTLTSERIALDDYLFEPDFPYAHRLVWDPSGQPILLGAGYYLAEVEGQSSIGTAGAGYFISAETGERLAGMEVEMRNAPAFAVDWHPERHLIAIGSSISTQVYQLSTGEFVGGYAPFGQGWLVSWSPDGRYLAVDTQIVPTESDERGLRVGSYFFISRLHAIAWHPNSTRLAVAAGSELRLEDLRLIPNFIPPAAP